MFDGAESGMPNHLKSAAGIAPRPRSATDSPRIGAVA
jgi:hypothetical protein